MPFKIESKHKFTISIAPGEEEGTLSLKTSDGSQITFENNIHMVFMQKSNDRKNQLHSLEDRISDVIKKKTQG